MLPAQRWFAARGRAIAGVSVRESVPLAEPGAWFLLLEVAFADGGRDLYTLPLVLRREAGAPGLLGRLPWEGEALAVDDALMDPALGVALLGAIERAARVPLGGGAIRCGRTPEFPRVPAGELAPRLLRGEQSHSSIVFGEHMVLKMFRRLTDGTDPDHEVTGFLTTRTRFRRVPVLYGTLVWERASQEPTTLGVLKRFVPNRGDAWGWIGEHLTGLDRLAAAEPPGTDALPHPRVREAAAPVLEAVGRLGALTAELHGALASVSDDPAFAPEPITAADATRWAGRIAEDLARTTALVRARRATLPPAVAPRAEALLEREETLTARLDDLGLLVGAGCVKIRVHGDYHLGQVLVVDDGFVILDFEGEPGRPLAERRAKRCAAVDVAGMLRSFEYAGSAARASAPAAPDHWTRWWVDIATRAFLDAYDGVASRLACRLLPASRADAARVRSVLELDKALYEVRYEIDRRPAWVGVALDGVARALGWPADV